MKEDQKIYTIGEVAKMLNLPISTLRYYDKEGLLLNLQRDTSSGVRKFNQQSLEALRLIDCLKKIWDANQRYKRIYVLVLAR